MRAPVPSSRTVRVLLVLATLLAVAIVAWLFYLVLSLSAQSKDTEVELHQSALDRDQLRAQNARQDAALAEANKQLAEAGKPQVPVPAEPTAVVGPRGPAGANGANASDAQVVAAVNAFCSVRNDCTGPMGPRGATGPAGPKGDTGAQGEQGERGLTGAPGPAGPTGAKGPKGDTGPAGADSTVPGPAGPAGPTGPAGKDAYPFTFTFTVQDNPVQSTTYTCTVTDPNTPATCTPAQ